MSLLLLWSQGIIAHIHDANVRNDRMATCCISSNPSMAAASPLAAAVRVRVEFDADLLSPSAVQRGLAKSWALVPADGCLAEALSRDFQLGANALRLVLDGATLPSQCCGLLRDGDCVQVSRVLPSPLAAAHKPADGRTGRPSRSARRKAEKRKRRREASVAAKPPPPPPPPPAESESSDDSSSEESSSDLEEPLVPSRQPPAEEAAGFAALLKWARGEAAPPPGSAVAPESVAVGDVLCLAVLELSRAGCASTVLLFSSPLTNPRQAASAVATPRLRGR